MSTRRGGPVDVIELGIDDTSRYAGGNGVALFVGGEAALQLACQHAERSNSVCGFECETIHSSSDFCYLGNNGKKRVSTLLFTSGQKGTLLVSGAIIEDRCTGRSFKVEVSQVFLAPTSRSISLMHSNCRYSLLQHVLDVCHKFTTLEFYEGLYHRHYGLTWKSVARHALNSIQTPVWITMLPHLNNTSQGYSTLAICFKSTTDDDSLVNKVKKICNRAGVARLADTTYADLGPHHRRSIVVYGSTEALDFLKKEIKSIEVDAKPFQFKHSQWHNATKTTQPCHSNPPTGRRLIPLVENLYMCSDSADSLPGELSLTADHDVVRNAQTDKKCRNSDMYASQLGRTLGIDTSLSPGERTSLFSLSAIGALILLRKIKKLNFARLNTAIGFGMKAGAGGLFGLKRCDSWHRKIIKRFFKNRFP